LGAFGGIGLSGDFWVRDCLRAFDGTGGGGIILADDCESDGARLDFLSMTFDQESPFVETSPRMIDESTSMVSSIGVVAASLPLPLDIVFCLDRLGAGSTDIGSESNGLTGSFSVTPETLRVVLTEVLETGFTGTTS
jgi:hypothetical protein